MNRNVKKNVVRAALAGITLSGISFGDILSHNSLAINTGNGKAAAGKSVSGEEYGPKVLTGWSVDNIWTTIVEFVK